MANNTNLSYPSAFCQQFFDKNGKPLVGGKLYTYIAGSSTPVVTYKNISGGTESANRNTNPIILDMAGMAKLVISNDTAYKFILFDRNDVKIDEWDNVTAGGSEGGGSSEEIVVDGTTNEINVSSNVTQGVTHYVVSLSNTIKSVILYLYGLYESVVNSLEGKADKVHGATAGNLAALDADGNITDSGSKVGDFKTKQTAVPDPSASGTGLEFISSVSQNANGEMTSSKKSVQDGTTAQKGVVKLNNAINSSSTTEAATPKAVKDAYDELNNKIVARATFLSQAEWDVQSQLPGDPAKVYYVENGTGEDAFIVYVWNTATNTYVEVDESSIDLEGYWHDGPTTTGDGNVVTSITLGNDGVPQVVKGITALTQHQDISNKLDKTGDASNTTSTFTIASSRTNISSGEKLSVIFGKIAKWFSDLKAVAFSGSYTDLSDKPTIPAAANNGSLTISQNNLPLEVFYANDSSIKFVDITTPTKTSDLSNDSGFLTEVTDNDINGTISDNHIASASTWNAKQNAISDLAEIRSGASAGASALQPSGNGSNVTSTFTAASSRTNISSGEKLSTIFGKIAKWFADLKAVAFSGSYSDLSGTPTIPEAATATPQAVSSSAGSAGSSNYFAKGDHVHKIVLDEGVNNGQVSIAGQSVSVKGWSTKQDALPTNTTPVKTYSINVSGTADHAIKSKIAYGSTSSSAASVTKSVTLANNIDYSERDFLVAVTFVNGNTHESYVNLSFDNVSYTITDSRVKWIRAGETFLFALNTATTSDGKLVGELNTTASLAENASGTTYTFTDNKGIAHSVNAYPYQSPTGVADTFRYNTQSFTNGTGSSLTKILTLNESGGLTLNWAQYVESRFDFINMTIRVCGFYNSTNASAEVITIEPYKYSSSYISAGLPELSNYILLLNDGVTHQFSFTLNMRMSYKEFLASIGGVGTTLYLGFTFGASSSSSSKHSITFANVWTRVTYHGDHS